MGFWEEVYRLREKGLIPRVWKRADLTPHLMDSNAEGAINAIPSNASISLEHFGIGNYVKNRQLPRAWRVGPPRSGQYQLIEDPEDDEATQNKQREKALSRARELRAMNGQEIRESGGPPYQQLPGNATSSQDLAEKMQDVLKAMEDKERYPLRGTPYRYDRPSDRPIPVEEWEVKFLEKWDARLNDRS